MKICSKCKVDKDESEFDKRKRSKDGLDPKCRACKKEYRKEYYKNNKEKELNKCREYQENNKEKIKEHNKIYNKEHYQNNKESISKQGKERRKNNKDKIKLRNKIYNSKPESKLKSNKRNQRYRKRHPEKAKLWRQNNTNKILENRVRRRNLMVDNTIIPFTKKQLDERLSLWGDYCCYCGVAFSDDNPMEKDHVVPLSRGGYNCLANIRPACRRCNRSKGSKLLGEWDH